MDASDSKSRFFMYKVGVKILRFLVWTGVFSILAVGILFTALTISLLCSDLNAYRSDISNALKYITQADWEIAGSLEFDIVGGPHITAYAVSVDLPDLLEKYAQAQIRAGKVRLYIRLLPLLRSELVVQQVDLDNPILILTEHPQAAVPPAVDATKLISLAQKSATNSTAVPYSSGNRPLPAKPIPLVTATPVQVDLNHDPVKELLNSIKIPTVNLHNGYLEWRNPQLKPYLIIRNLNTVLHAEPSPQFLLHGAIEISSQQEAVSVLLRTRLQQKEIQTHMNGELQLTVFPISYPEYTAATSDTERKQAIGRTGLTLATNWSMNWERQLQEIQLTQLTVTGEECEIIGDFSLNVPLTAQASLQGNNTKPWGEGNLTVKRLSLPRWLNSLRTITRPIRYQLHELTAKGRIILANNTIALTDLEINLPAIQAHGTGAVAAPKGFSLDVQANAVAFEDIFPPKAQRKDIPKFDATQMAFITGPSTGTPTPIDITLGANTLSYKKIVANDARMHLYPPGRGGALQLDLPIHAIAGGKAELMAMFEKGGQYGTVTVHNVQLQQLYFLQSKNITSQGTLSGEMAFRNLETNPLSIELENLHTLAGKLHVIKGICTIDKHPYRASQTIFDINGLIGMTTDDDELLLIAAQPSKKNSAHITTDHALASGLALESIDLTLTANSSGSTGNMLWYPETETLVSSAIPGSFMAHGISTYPQYAEKWKGEGSFTLITGAKVTEVTLHALQANFFDFSLNGDFTAKNIFYDTGTPQISGSFSLMSPQFRQSIAKLGYLFNDIPNSCLQLFALKGDMLLQEKSFALTIDTLDINKGSTLAHGSLRYNQGWKDSTTRPKASFTLTANTINFDEYFPKNSERENLNVEPWELAGLEKIDLQGQLTVAQTRYWDFPFTNVQAKVQLEKGQLSLHPLTAQLFNAPVSGSFTGLVVNAAPNEGKALDVAMNLEGKNIPLEPIATILAKAPYLEGPAEVRINLTGRVRKSTDRPKLLNGTLFLHANEGLLRTEKDASPTKFSEFFISGSVKKGVFYNDNLKITSALMDITGKGWIDLDTETIDYTATAVVIKGPTIPIRFHGNLHDPKSSMNPVNIVAETAGTITLGLYDIVEGIVTLPFKIFTGNKSSNNTAKSHAAPPVLLPANNTSTSGAHTQETRPHTPETTTNSPSAHEEQNPLHTPERGQEFPPRSHIDSMPAPAPAPAPAFPPQSRI